MTLRRKDWKRLSNPACRPQNKMFLLALAAFNALFLEFTLLKLLDIILYANLALLIISLAFFAFGLSALFVGALRTEKHTARVDQLIGKNYISAHILAVLALFVFIKTQNLAYTDLLNLRGGALFQWLCFIFLITVPFMINGVAICWLFVREHRTPRAYFFDLSGAGVAALLFPFVLGTGGIDACFLLLGFSTALPLFVKFSGKRRTLNLVLLALFGLSYLLIRDSPLTPYTEKWRTPYSESSLENSLWVPTGRIDVVAGRDAHVKTVVYDGGNIGSPLFRFDGDYAGLRRRGEENPEADYLRAGVLASHLLKADQGAEVLQIGIGAAQEVKAALSFGAAKIIGVELNPAVIRLLRSRYSDFGGHVLNDPRLQLVFGDGRGFLERHSGQFDIIQLFSTYIQSAFMQGRGALDANYLYTTEAFETYFRHLKPGGLLHLNHPNPYRLVRNAAQAWKNLGHEDFRRHVIVIADREARDIFPTLLIKESPFTAVEAAALTRLHAASRLFDYVYEISPFTPDRTPYWREILSGDPLAMRDYFYDVSITGDDRPFSSNFYNFRFVPTAGALERLDRPERNVFETLARHVYSPINVLRWSAPLLLGILCLVLLIPLQKTGRPARLAAKTGFALLGVTYIGLQYWVLFQFSRFLDSPHLGAPYVISVFVLAAGLGGLLLGPAASSVEPAPKDVASPQTGFSLKSWLAPAALLVMAGILQLGSGNLADILYRAEEPLVRTAAVSACIALVGFCSGFFFPAAFFGVRGLEPADRMRLWALNSLCAALAGPLILTLFLNCGFRTSFTLLAGANFVLFIVWMLADRFAGSFAGAK